MTRTITWQTLSGKTATVNIELVTQRRLWADGDEMIVDCCDLRIVGEVAGHGTVGYSISRTVSARARELMPNAGGMCGDLVIPAVQMEQIEAVIAECKATPEWQERERRERIAEQENERYENRRRLIERTMHNSDYCD